MSAPRKRGNRGGMIKQSEYARRRRQLMRRSGEGSTIIVCAAPWRIRNNDVRYCYRQDSDFLYLTGFREPGAVLVLIPGEDKAALFCRPRDPEREMWDGEMIGLEGAISGYGMDESHDIADIGRKLPAMLRDRDRVYYDLGRDPAFDQRLIGWLHDLRETKRRNFHAPEEIHGLDHMLHDMRVYKSREELRVMRRSACVAIEAHQQAMRACKPGMNEADVHAELLHAFIRNRCEPSYPPIVGGGRNACVLHYIDNDQDLAGGDLLLIDAGAEFDGYASDVTRTIPVSGRFSAEQRALYEVVLAAQCEAIDQVRAGKQWDEVHDAAVRVATEGLVELGILKGDPATLIEQDEHTRYYVHKTGHWLGLDVHDVGAYAVEGRPRTLAPGMVYTVEPGLYVSETDTRAPAEFRGIGIRIEDDVAITPAGHENLTAAIAKRPDDVEAWVRDRT